MKKKTIRPNRKRFLAALGRQIRRHRIRAGMSQREAATIADIAPSYLSSIERGKGNVRMDKLERLAHAIGISMVKIFLGIEAEIHPGRCQKPACCAD